jgi:hypothetical protein
MKGTVQLGKSLKITFLFCLTTPLMFIFLADKALKMKRQRQKFL